MFRRLLVAYDGSDHAERALSDAVALAQENRGRLTVLAVAPEPSVWAFSGYGVPVDIDGLSCQIERACSGTFAFTVRVADQTGARTTR